MFCVVEQKEPHAGRFAFRDVEQPATFAARCELARRMRDELEVPLPIFVDGMDDASRALFSDLPSPAFVIDRQGRIADKLPWADPEQLAKSIQEAVDDSPLPSTERAALTVDERDAIARRFLAAGEPATALRWLDAKPDGEVSVPPTFVALARAALTRCAASRGASVAERDAALAAAADSVTSAWSKDRPRLVAARVELAEQASGAGAEAALWQSALDALDERAPEATRVWLRQQVETHRPQPAGGQQGR